MKYIEALFVDGVFRPINPVELEPGSRLILGLVELSSPAMEPSKTPDQLTKLEQEILKTVHSVMPKGLDEIVENVRMRLDTKRVPRTQVECVLDT